MVKIGISGDKSERIDSFLIAFLHAPKPIDSISSMSFSLRVNLGPRSYDIVIDGGAGGIGPFARERSRGKSALIVGDENTEPHARRVLADLQGVGFRAALAARPAGE